jgi:hypothetical protein
MKEESNVILRISEEFMKKVMQVKGMPGMVVPNWKRRALDERVKIVSCEKEPEALLLQMFPEGEWNPDEYYYPRFLQTMLFRHGGKATEILEVFSERWMTVFSGMIPLKMERKEKRLKKTYDVFDLMEKMEWKEYKEMQQEEYYDNMKKYYSIEERLDKYEFYMIQRQNKVPLMRQTYSDPLTFYATYRYQTTLYEELFKQLVGTKLYIVGDGSGTASAAAIRNKIEYYSYEPNGIGMMARKLGIITSDVARKAGDQDVTFLGNVMGYDLAVETFSDRILIVDESRCSMTELDMVEVEESEGKIWRTKNVHIEIPRIRFLPVANCVHMLPEKVKPLDVKASYFAKKNGFIIAEEGFPICTSTELNGFNILTRDWAYGKMFKAGMKKFVDGRVMTVYNSEHEYLKTDKLSIKYFEHYSSATVVDCRVCEAQPNGMFKITIKNPGRVRFIEFLDKQKVKVIPVSVYKDYGIFQLADYVERLARVKMKV